MNLFTHLKFLALIAMIFFSSCESATETQTDSPTPRAIAVVKIPSLTAKVAETNEARCIMATVILRVDTALESLYQDNSPLMKQSQDIIKKNLSEVVLTDLEVSGFHARLSRKILEDLNLLILKLHPQIEGRIQDAYFYDFFLSH